MKASLVFSSVLVPEELGGGLTVAVSAGNANVMIDYDPNQNGVTSAEKVGVTTLLDVRMIRCTQPVSQC
jgi:hypothetical protein